MSQAAGKEGLLLLLLPSGARLVLDAASALAVLRGFGRASAPARDRGCMGQLLQELTRTCAAATTTATVISNYIFLNCKE